MRHCVVYGVLQKRLGKFNVVPFAVHIGADAELFGKAKLKLLVGAERCNKSEIAVMENKVAKGIGATGEFDGELVIKIKDRRERAPGFLTFTCRNIKL